MPTRDRRGRRRATSGGIVLIVATAGAVATYTPLFAAREIHVVGSPIPRRALLALASVDGRSNVFHLDVEGVERRLERDPRILDATVTTSLPDAIRIVVTSREAVAVTGDPSTLVGPDGVLIGPAVGTTEPLPRISGDDLRSAAAAAAAMSDGLRGSVRTIVVRPDGGIGLRLDQGLSAYLGDASDLPAKATSLAALLDWATREGVRIVSADVSVPGSPTAELEEGGSLTSSG